VFDDFAKNPHLHNLLISTDFGVSYVPLHTYVPYTQGFVWFTSVSINLDGSIIIATMSDFNVYRSRDLGVSWTLLVGAKGSGNFVSPVSAVCSASGKYVFVWRGNNAVQGVTGEMRLSSDYGDTFKSSVSTTYSIVSLFVSDTGYCVIVSYPDVRVSSDFINWNISPQGYWMSNVLFSSDGLNILATRPDEYYNSRILFSINSGLTWSPLLSPAGQWNAITSDTALSLIFGSLYVPTPIFSDSQQIWYNRAASLAIPVDVTTTPTRSPIYAPSSHPSSQPTSKPSRPTAVPSFVPTATPSIQEWFKTSILSTWTHLASSHSGQIVYASAVDRGLWRSQVIIVIICCVVIA
jgi:hypothetical protein